MKILLVNKFFYRKGGSETYMYALAEGLREMGHEVAFFSMQHPSNEPSYWSKYFVSEKDYNGNTSLFRKVGEAVTIAYSPEARRKFEALLEDFKPDIIHLNLVHRQLTFSILDAPYLKKHHVPVVYTAHDYSLICPAYTMINGRKEICESCIHGNVNNVFKNVCTKGSKAKSLLSYMEAEFLKLHRSYDKIDLIIACSQFMKTKLDEGGYAERTITMQNFLTQKQIDMGRYVTNNHKYIDEVNGIHPYFLFFGRLSAEKGIRTLVKAFISACQSAGHCSALPANWDLHIIGDGPERSAIEHLIFQAPENVRPRIHMLGYEKGLELQQEVGNARYSILASEWYENMPYSGLESLSAQTPVIGANIGGIPEIVINRKTGFRFKSGNIEDLRSRLLIAANMNRTDYAVMQQQCAEYVKVHCNHIHYAEKLTEKYIQLCCKKHH